MEGNDPLDRFRAAVQSGDATRVRRLFDDHPDLRDVIDVALLPFEAPALVEAVRQCNRELIDALLDLCLLYTSDAADE